MKFIISILALFCVSLSALGQSYTYRPTPYTQPFVQTIFDAASARTYLGVTNGPESTNIALLNGTNTFTGTNTFSSVLVSAGMRCAVITVATNYTVSVLDWSVLVNATSSNVTVTLPATTLGQVFNLKKIDSSTNSCIINTTGGKTIDGSNSITNKTPKASITVQSNGTNWFII